jgi:hypothetical protein
LKKYKLPDNDQILAELIQVGGKMLLSAIHKLINSVWNKEELPDQWKESIIVQVHKKGDKTDCNNYPGISLREQTIMWLYKLKIRSSDLQTVFSEKCIKYSHKQILS